MPDLQYTLKKLADIYDLGNSGAEDRDFFWSIPDESTTPRW